MKVVFFKTFMIRFFIYIKSLSINIKDNSTFPSIKVDL